MSKDRMRPGPTQKGNLDLSRRPVVHNDDGSISTVRTMTVGMDDGEYNIPTVVEDKILDDEAAIAHFARTGEHLGRYKSPDEAIEQAKYLHDAQADMYLPRQRALDKMGSR
jgi:hypothetical protein